MLPNLYVTEWGRLDSKVIFRVGKGNSLNVRRRGKRNYMSEQYEIYKTEYGYRWRFRAENGEIIAAGQEYSRRIDCINAIEMMKYSQDVPVVVVQHKRKGNIVAPTDDEASHGE
jgi:uncharacterized protein YegP (UPF0339 family)